MRKLRNGAIAALILAVLATRDQPGAATGGVVVVLLVLAALVGLVRSRAGGAGRRVSVGHSHGGTPPLIARHEAGHAAVARALGYRGVHVETWNDGRGRGGATWSTSGPEDPVAKVAVARAGQYATGRRAGCAGDDDIVRGVLRGVPRDQRAAVRRDGEALGRRTVRREGGAIRRDAATIERTGRLS